MVIPLSYLVHPYKFSSGIENNPGIPGVMTFSSNSITGSYDYTPNL